MQHAFTSNVSFQMYCMPCLYACQTVVSDLSLLVSLVEPLAIEAQLEIEPAALAAVEWQPDDVA